MTLEEAQAEILKLQDDLKAIQTERDSLKIQTDKDVLTIQDLNKNIDTMREHNNALFLRVSQQNQYSNSNSDNTKDDKKDTEEKPLSVDDLSALLLNK